MIFFIVIRFAARDAVARNSSKHWALGPTVQAYSAKRWQILGSTQSLQA